MATFGKSSRSALSTCDKRLIRLCEASILLVDFAILEGYRGKEAQNAAFKAGLSKLKWPFGNHNTFPSKALDFAPYPIDWRDTSEAHGRFCFVAGVMWAVARQQGIKIRFGWDWNRNLDPRDENFLDWGHVELDEA